MDRRKEGVVNVLLRYPGRALLLREVTRAISYGTIYVEQNLVVGRVSILKSWWDERCCDGQAHEYFRAHESRDLATPLIRHPFRVGFWPSRPCDIPRFSCRITKPRCYEYW
jgi:hypothetical protein